jgi:hypothetical protein
MDLYGSGLEEAGHVHVHFVPGKEYLGNLFAGKYLLNLFNADK